MTTISAVTRLIEAAKEAYNALELWAPDAGTIEKLEKALTALPPDAGEYCMVPREAIKDAYSEGFSDGQDHGGLDWKYPPEDLAWYFSQTRNGFVEPAIRDACYERKYKDPWPSAPKGTT